jgi:hypothetical protein
MNNEQLTAIVQRALISGLQRHSKMLYGSAVEVPQVPVFGRYDRISGHFALVDVARDITAAVEAAASEVKP